MEIIPAIDLKDQQCVRLKQGRMEETTVFSDQPAEMALHWQQQGATRLHLVDLNGAFAGEPKNLSAIKAIISACPKLKLQLGGGIRTLETVERYLSMGIHSIIIGTQAIKDPPFVTAACKAFPGHIMVGLDAKADKIAINGWDEVTEKTVTEYAKRFADAGISAIIYTDINRDGMLQGINVASTQALAQSTQVPIIASGGVHTIEDIKQLCSVTKSGISGVIVGRALYEGTLQLADAITYTQRALS